MQSPAPLKVNDTLWYVPQGGQSTVLDDAKSLVTIADMIATPQGLILKLSNGAAIRASDLRGFIERVEEEDMGAVKEEQPLALQPFPDQWKTRIVKTHYNDPVRCWRSKADWQAHVETQRAWNKLASRILCHNVDNMDPFTVDDIEAAELALFGNIEK